MKAVVEFTDVNNNENKGIVDVFDTEPGYYQQVIRSMLVPGHETELIYWLKNVGLIPNTQICSNAKSNDSCNKLMEWTPAKVVDFYQWKCKNCAEKKSIRENSIFFDVKCSFKHSVRILLGWCKGYNIEMMANLLGVKKHAVRVLYNATTVIAKKGLKSHNRNLLIGGPGVIVLIDNFPEGCVNYNRPARGNRPILCLGEAKDLPPRYWFEPLDRYGRNNTEQIANVKEHILKTIQDVVLPGSIIVTRLDSTLCSFYDLQELSNLYPTIVSVDGLARHNTVDNTIQFNLETIWKNALDICEEAQLYSFEEVPNFLISQMWNSRFRNEAFETLLNHLTDMR